MRRAVEQADSAYRPRIDLTLEPEAHLLRFADNGSGLTEEEIHTYLTVIGRGYTRIERCANGWRGRGRWTAACELVGQFGIGFLSAFLLASEVTVETARLRRTAAPLEMVFKLRRQSSSS